MNSHPDKSLLNENNRDSRNGIIERNHHPNHENNKLNCSKFEQTINNSTLLIDNYKNKHPDAACFTSVKSFVICLSLLQLAQVMGSGYGKSALTSIERRYRLSSFEVGLLQSCFHIGNLSVILFVSYFGSKWHRPRAIAIGSVVMAFSSFLSATPQFVGERYHVTSYRSFVAPPSPQSNEEAGPSSYYHISGEPFTLRDSGAGEDEPVVVLGNITAFLAFQKEVFEKENKTSKWDDDLADELLVLHFQNWQREQAALSTSGVTLSPEIVNSLPPQLVARQRKRNQSQLLPEKNASPGAEKLCKSPSDFTGSPVLGENTGGSQSSETKDDSSFYIFIAVGSILKGMGHTPLHPLGMSFIDDFATSRNSAIYIGVVSAVSLLGPAFGFIIGSQTAKLWVDIGWVDTSTVTIGPHDSSWVGAWWMGYLITGAMLLVAMIPLSFFPRVIKVEEGKQENEESNCVSCITACFPDQKDINADSSSIGSECGSNASDFLETERNGKAEMADNVTSEKTCDQVTKKVVHDGTIGESLKQRAAIAEVPHSNTVPTMLYLDNDGKCAKTRLLRNNAPCDVRRSTSVPQVARTAKRIPRSRSDGYSRSSFGLENRRRSLGIHQTVTNMALKDFAFTLKQLLNDRVFISITLGFVSLTSFLAASMTYAAKYMETEFDLTASHANLLNGSVNLPMAVAGNILGGLILRRRNLNVKRTIAGVLLSVVLTILSITILLFLGCDNKKIVGVNNEHSGRILKCSTSCGCSDAHFFPVCDVTVNLTYRSPCHAGCKSEQWIENKQIFLNCDCLLDSSLDESQNTNPNATSGILVAGKCAQPYCWYTFAAFVALMGTASMTAGLSVSPSTLTILRVVPSTDKAIAIGVVFVFTRILAWIPAPVYVGSAIDAACLVWTSANRSNLNSDDQNHCELYDKARLRQYFFGAICMQLFLASVFYALALYLVTRRDKERGKLRHGSSERPQKINLEQNVRNKQDETQDLK